MPFFLETSSSRQFFSSFNPSQKHASSWQQKVKIGEHHFRSTTASGQCLTSKQCIPPSFHLRLIRVLLYVMARLLTALKFGLCLKTHHSTLSVLLLYLVSQLIEPHSNSACITTPIIPKMLCIQRWHYGKGGVCASGTKVLKAKK